MLNLYEILEVSEKASKEVIEKAYRVLAKKYHPDLQLEENIKDAENKMKQINEAYEILSNDEKRKQYDIELQNIKKEQKRREQIEIQNNQQKTYNEHIRQQEMYNNQKIRNEQIDYEKEVKRQEYNNNQKLQNEMKRAYAQAYNDYWRSKGYKIKEPWTLKRFIELLKVIGILAIIIAVIWFFPPTHKLIIDFYEQNEIIQTIVNIFVDILQGIWNAIVQFFQNTF